MRTIKFRGKRIDSGEWVYGSLVCHKPPYHSKCDIWCDDGEWHEVVPESVGQFTGLLDSEGKEIYEGDIVKSNDNYRIYKIIFEKGEFRLSNRISFSIRDVNLKAITII